MGRVKKGFGMEWMRQGKMDGEKWRQLVLLFARRDGKERRRGGKERVAQEAREEEASGSGGRCLDANVVSPSPANKFHRRHVHQTTFTSPVVEGTDTWRFLSQTLSFFGVIGPPMGIGYSSAVALRTNAFAGIGRIWVWWC